MAGARTQIAAVAVLAAATYGVLWALESAVLAARKASEKAASAPRGR